VILTEGILVGFGLGALLFLHRMSQALEVEHAGPLVEADKADAADPNNRGPYDPGVATDPEVVVYRISGAFFFGTAATASAVLDRLAVHPKAYVVDVSAVTVLDSTAATTIEGFVRKAHRAGAMVYIAGARPAIRRALLLHGVRPPRVRFRTALADAVEAARARAEGASQAEAAAADAA